MITLLADSNALRHDGLRAYLGASRSHGIAFSDLTLVEMRKTKALGTSRDSLLIASQFPGQAFVLRRTDLMLNENIVSADQIHRLFDYEAGLELEQLGHRLRLLPAPADLNEFMANVEADAAEIMQRLTVEVASFEAALVDVAARFTPTELNRIATDQALSDATKQKLLEILKESVGSFILRNQDPDRRAPMSLREARGLFGFRYCLCTMIYYIQWVRTGRGTGKKLERTVNDVVDMQIAAMGSYLNGILTADGRLQTISQASRDLLRGFGAYVGDDWRPLPPSLARLPSE